MPGVNPDYVGALEMLRAKNGKNKNSSTTERSDFERGFIAALTMLKELSEDDISSIKHFAPDIVVDQHKLFVSRIDTMLSIANKTIELMNNRNNKG